MSAVTPDDEVFLRLNGWIQMVSEDQIAAAQSLRSEEERQGMPFRTLAEILKSLGALREDHCELLRSMSDALSESIRRRVSGAGDPALPESDSSSRKSSITNRPSSRAVRPPEVQEASRDERNRLGHYVLLQMVGKGGMGSVYRAWDDTVGRIVALKVLLESSFDSVERFIREAQMAARLRHPAIATVYEVGEVGGRHYLAMDFIEGEVLGRRPMPVARTLEVIRDCARALQHAHDQKIIHRDVKPRNIMVDQTGAIFLTDFGLAKEVTPNAANPLTMSGVVVGTVEYMSPEQAKGETRGVDFRTDIFSLGVTLYTLLAGQPPFRLANVMDTMRAIVERKPPPLRTLNTAVSPALEAVVEHAMEKDPAKRFPSAAAFADELEQLLRDKRFLGRYGLAKYLVRKWLPFAAAGVLLALAARVGLDVLSAPPPGVTRLDPAELTRAATIALGAIEDQLAKLPADERRAKLQRDVIGRLDTVLTFEPRFLPARVARVRALYLDGRAAEAAAELGGLAEDRRRDYRIPFLRALISLEAALGQAPLPALEAPVPDWQGPPAPWPASIATDLLAAEGSQTEKAGIADYARDGPAAKALLALLESKSAPAAVALEDVASRQPIPLYARAWCRAAYLARRFQEVRDSPRSAGLRERLGARLALASGAVPPLEALLPECGSDAEAVAWIRTALARRAVEAGRDPEDLVKAGLAGLTAEVPLRDELAGALLCCRLRRRALAGADLEEGHREALRLLGAAPRSWVGKLSAVEIRLARGGRSPRAWLEEAVSGANALSTEAPGWDAPRLLRASAYLRLARPHDALGELSSLGADPGALVVSAAVKLSLAEERRRNGLSAKGELADCLKDAAAALAGRPDHPEALNLAAAAALAVYEDGPVESGGRLLEESLAQLDRALLRAPGFVEVLVHRGQARFLRAQAGPGSGDYAGALADLDAALAAVPGMAAARSTRGIVRFSAGLPSKALEDWRLLAKEDPAFGGEALEAWIRRAEAEAGR